MNCKNCKKQGCFLSGKSHEMSFECKAYVGKTNADRIRAMSDEELAELFESWIQDCGCNNVPCSEPCKRDREREITDWRDALEHKSCYDCWLDWLKQGADNGQN